MSIYHQCMLFVPGRRLEWLDKARACGSSAVIVDLEDSVALSEKTTVRLLVAEKLGSLDQTFPYVVRVNGVDSGLMEDDIRAVVSNSVSCIMLPKVESMASIAIAAEIISEVEDYFAIRRNSIDLLPIIETAAGLAAAREIAGASPRVKRLSFGAADFVADTGMEWSRNNPGLTAAKTWLVISSRVADLAAPVDSVFADVRDPEGLRLEAEQARALGFAGKACIHPDQVSVVSDVFGVRTAELEWSRKIVMEFERAERQGIASIAVDGRLVDYAMVKRAKQIISENALG